ncbi:MAG: hypothetical protein ACLQVK_07230 [Acidimicrobiales bacterium]
MPGTRFVGQQPSSPTAADVAIVGVVLVAGLVLPAALALGTQTFDIPRNDDWAYLRVLGDFVQTGHLSLVGWGSMTLVGQIFWAAPFAAVLGAHAWVGGVAVGFFSAIGLVAAYIVARSLLSRTWAGGCVLLTLAFPGFLLNTTSFMTDVPAFSADMVCLALGLAALRRVGGVRWALVALSLVVGCFGFCIREFGLAAPLAVLVALVSQDRRRWRLYGGAAMCVLAVCGAAYIWTTHLPGAQPKVLSQLNTSTLKALAALYFTFSFALSPILPTTIRRVRRLISLPDIVLALAVLAVGAWLIHRGGPIFVGNYVDQLGATGPYVLGGTRPVLFSGPLWRSLEIVAVGAGAAFALLAIGTCRRVTRSLLDGTSEGLVGAFAVLSGAALVVYGLFVNTYDRYLWPLAFAGAVALLSTSTDLSRPRGPGSGHFAARRLRNWTVGATSVGLTGIVVAVAIALVLNADAYDGARWKAGQVAVKAGIAASEVDAGFEWVGSHATEDTLAYRKLAGAPAYETWYDQMFPGFRDCAVVSGSPQGEAALELVGTTRYNELGFAVPERLYIYVVRSPGCRR